jgi:hypothetical protein
MATREELLEHLWRYVINANLDPAALHNRVVRSQLRPDEPFADSGPALERLLAAYRLAWLHNNSFKPKPLRGSA